MQRRNNILRNLDWVATILYVVLVLMGWLNIYAAVYSDEHRNILDFSQRYGKQLVWIFFAFLMAIVILYSNDRIFPAFAYIFYGIILITLISTLLFGRVVNASKSWIPIGSFGLQPAEFAKIATALALAKLMSSYGFKLSGFWSYVKVAVIIGLPVGIILLQNDTGSALVFGALILVLYREGLPAWILSYLVFLVIVFILTLVYSTPVLITFIFVVAVTLFVVFTRQHRDAFRIFIGAAGVGLLLYISSELFHLRLSYSLIFLIPVLISAVLGFLYAYKNRLRQVYAISFFLIATIGFSMSADYVFERVLDVHHQKRINDLLGIEDDPLGWGYNVNQSKIAIGSGGFWGKGYLSGTQTKFNFVPEQSTDFIFCTVGEEWGFLGSTVVVLLIALFLLRLLKIAERQTEHFARIYGYGVVSILFFHAAVNIGMTIGLVPVIGIPLPFFSYGGSSLWAFTILVFILLRFDASRYGSY